MIVFNHLKLLILSEIPLWGFAKNNFHTSEQALPDKL